MYKVFGIFSVFVYLLLFNKISFAADKTLYTNVSILHNSYFKNPILPLTIDCKDCNGFRYFPKFGYSIGIHSTNYFSKNIGFIARKEQQNR